MVVLRAYDLQEHHTFASPATYRRDMRTKRTRFGPTPRSLAPLVVALGLALSLVVPLGPATAATRTTIGGWSTTPVTLEAGTGVRRTVTVLTGGRAVERRVVLQFRAADATGWTVLDATRSGRRGAATLDADVVPGTGALRAKAPATRTAAARLTAATRVTVSTPTDPEGPADPGSTPSAFEAEVLRLTNEVRAAGTTCGTRVYGSRPPVTLSPELTTASRAYARRMGEEAFFAHTSPSGDDPGDRATAAGYAWRGYGENIAAGYRTPATVVEGWRTSEGHCHNMMGGFVHLGVGHAVVDGSPFGHYWVQMFGVPR